MTFEIPESLNKELEEQNLLAIGEIHGVKENALVYEYLVTSLGIECLALEWPTPLKRAFDTYFDTAQMEISKLQDFLEDGRINTEYLEVFKQLRIEGHLKSFIYFDNYQDYANKEGWNPRDESYAKEFLNQFDSEVKTLLIAGNMHTQTEPFSSEFEDGTLYPMLHHVKKEISQFPIITIKYYEGSFYNYGIQNLGQSDTPTPTDTTIREVREYLYEIDLPHISPVTIPTT